MHPIYCMFNMSCDPSDSCVSDGSPTVPFSSGLLRLARAAGRWRRENSRRTALCKTLEQPKKGGLVQNFQHAGKTNNITRGTAISTDRHSAFRRGVIALTTALGLVLCSVGDLLVLWCRGLG